MNAHRDSGCRGQMESLYIGGKYRLNHSGRSQKDEKNISARRDVLRRSGSRRWLRAGGTEKIEMMKAKELLEKSH